MRKMKWKMKIRKMKQNKTDWAIKYRESNQVTARDAMTVHSIDLRSWKRVET